VVRPEEFGRYRANVEGWVGRHPIRHSFSSRPSIAVFASVLQTDARSAFVAVEATSETIEAVSERLNTYAAQLPKVARWQAELLLSEEAGERDVEGALGDVHALGTAARRANEILDDVPGLVNATGSPVRAALADERRAVLGSVDTQRRQTLEFLTAERLAVLAAVREERIATLAALHEERIESLKEVDAIKSRAVEATLVGLRDLFDYTLGRVAALLLGLMVSAAALTVVAYRLTVGRG